MLRPTLFFFLILSLFFAAGQASAQFPALSCVLNAGVPPIIRAEGLAELVADVIVNCTGGNPASPFNVNWQIFLNTNITSRLIGGSPSTTEALLLIDEPCPSPVPPGFICPGAPIAVGTNAFRGDKASANSIVWLGVPFTPPGTTGTRIIRITDVRANANQLGLSPTLIPTQVTMFISATGSQAVPINNPTLTVGFIASGITSDLRTCDNSAAASPAFQQCVSENSGLAAGTSANGNIQFAIRFREAFATAFKNRIATGQYPQDPSVPGSFFNTESGYVNSSVLGSETGFATQGTRLMARFTNVPAGARVFVTTGPLSTSSSGLGAALTQTDASGGGAFSAVTGTGTGMCLLNNETKPIAEVALSAGAGIGVWEITASNAFASETALFGVVVAYQSASVSTGTASFSARFAPESSITVMSSTAPAPRFVASGSASNLFSVSACSCTYSITTMSQSFGPSGGSDGVNVTAGTGCNWTASSNAAWLTITSGSSGSGNGSVGYLVAANPVVNSRMGTLTVAGQTFTVTQAGHIFGPSKIGIYRSGVWLLDANGNGISDQSGDRNFFLGWSGAVQVTGDWTGDGVTKAGVYSNGYWFLDYNGNGVWDGPGTDKQVPWGWVGATPIVGDWNGDGKSKIGVYSNGFWFLDYNGDYVWDGGVIDKQAGWGWSGATPMVGDWNGDGKTKIGVYSDGFWFLDYNGDYVWDGGVVDKQVGWGWSGVTPIVGDWNGDGRTKIGAYAGGNWYIDYDGNYLWQYPASDKIWSFGWTGTVPVIGDWNGDGKSKAGCFINGYWYLDYNGNGTFDGSGTDRIYAYGATGDSLAVGRW